MLECLELTTQDVTFMEAVTILESRDIPEISLETCSYSCARGLAAAACGFINKAN
jgi:hypothetical protein